MKEKIERMFSQSRSTILLAIYSLVLVLMGYKLLTSTTISELVLFAIPTVCCFYAIFGTKRENSFALVKEMVYTQCKPEEALKVMEDDPSMFKKQRQQNSLHLMKAYALMDIGRCDEAITYVTVTEKEAFSTEAAAPIAAYLLFTAAFLSRNTELCRHYHEVLLEKREAFTVDGRPTFLWYILAANHQTASGHFEKAEKMMAKVDETQLKTTRDQAYLAYYRYRVLAGLEQWEEALEQLSRARELAPGIRVFTEKTDGSIRRGEIDLLVDTKHILMEALNVGTAVPAPDCIDLDSIRVFIRVAESLSKPVILSFAEALTDMIFLEEAAQITKLLAQDAAVPIGLHLDHGSTLDVIRRAVDLGFTSVMIDASTKNFEENVAITRDVVGYAHGRGVSVEAELGHVGQGSEYSSYDHSNNIYTDTADAVRFVEQTGVDFLAVSIGTAHGQYQNMAKPTLNFDRLRQLREVLDIPLVLHGGSGSGDDNLRRCAREGIQKINIFTDFLTSAMDAIQRENPLGYLDLKRSANRAMEHTLRHYYEVFG